jgi:hypothetical protein
MTFKQFISGYNQNEPLNNFQIIKKCKELKIKKFKGVFMRDELNIGKKVGRNECMVINIDHSQNIGTHWTCLFIRNRQNYYFDSYGLPPTLEVKKYCIGPIDWNSFHIQKNEVICGHYCIYVLYKLGIGEIFYNILDELYRHNFE